MDAKKFPIAIPVLISTLPHDTITRPEDIKKMADHLQDLGANIDFLFLMGFNTRKKVKLRSHCGMVELAKRLIINESYKSF